MILRPTGRALINAGLRSTVSAVPGLLLVYAAWSSAVIVPAIFGTPLIILGLVIFANAAFASVQLEAGVLTGRSLLGRIAVRVDQISKIVPINLSYRRTLLMPWNRRAKMFDVCTIHGPTGLWLNPNVYGERPIEQLIHAVGVVPQADVENRVLDVLTLNRNYGKGRVR